jgi:ABC-type multidrug transport system fused ATPase/permease subunit
MPSLQQIYTNAVGLRFGTPALHNIHGELVGSHGAAPDLALPDGAGAASRRVIERCDASAPLDQEPLPFILRAARSARLEESGRALSEEGALTHHGQEKGAEQASATLALTERLELEHVSFTYPGAHRPALRDVSLTIAANTTVGIMGPTGSGKTTLVDIILGLLRPDSGKIRVDGVEVTNANLRTWQSSLGYVPQHIYLTDDSIAANIAFGVAPDRVDSAAVERAARLAQIHTFIAEDLPEGYETVVGERGIRLSGGQRQRIGIARALYHDPGLLVFDEATSALDNDTEAALMDAIARLAGTRTIILIAHRLTTLKGCDATLRVHRGQLAPCGPEHGRHDQTCVDEPTAARRQPDISPAT